MSRLRSWWLRLVNLFRKDDFEEEIESHLQMHIEDNLDSGMSPAEARREALIKLGGMQQTVESYRDRRSIPWLEHFLQDVRYGTRTLRQNPGFTAVAVLTLALGIGANTAVFSIVDVVLLKPLPYFDPDRLVILWEQNPGRGWTENIVSAANFEDWRRQNDVFSDMAAIDPTSFNLSGRGEPVEIGGERVTANLLSVLGVRPVLGRGFLAEDGKPGSTPVVLLSHALWQSRYGGDSGIVGNQIILNNQSYTVIGVLPGGFSDLYTSFFRVNAQVWVSGLELRDVGRTSHEYLALARMKPGITLAQAQMEMDLIASRIEQQYPENEGWGVQVVRVYDQVVGHARPTVLVLMAAVLFVLLIACVNMANLLLARSASRERELAVRSALGAGRGRIVRQVLTESLLLALFGGAAGLLVARWGLRALIAMAPPDTPGIADVAISQHVLAFALLVTLVTGLLFGLVPALGVARPNLNAILRESGRGMTGSAHRSRLRGFLVAAEFALVLVLVVGATLMVKTLVRLRHFDLGFKPDHVLTLRIPLRGPQREEHSYQAAFFRRLLSSLEGMPGIRSASVCSGLPIADWSGMGFVKEEDPNPSPERHPDANYMVIGPRYFETMGIPLRFGRVFSEADAHDSKPVVLVNQELADRYWPGQDPIGKRLKSGFESGAPWLTIVGVAANVATEGPESGFHPELYVPYGQYPWLLSPRFLVVRTYGDPLAAGPTIFRQIAAIDSEQPISDVRALDEIAGGIAAQQHFLMMVLGILAALALTLAGVGIYGVMAYSVAQRRHEIGIRMAVGARPYDLLRLVLASGLAMEFAGISAGAAVAAALTRYMKTLLFEVDPVDPWTFMLVALALAAAGLVACYIPARRAFKIDPLVALRCE